MFTADQAREIVALYKQSLNAATTSRRRRAGKNIADILFIVATLYLHQ